MTSFQNRRQCILLTAALLVSAVAILSASAEKKGLRVVQGVVEHVANVTSGEIGQTGDQMLKLKVPDDYRTRVTITSVDPSVAGTYSFSTDLSNVRGASKGTVMRVAGNLVAHQDKNGT